MGTALAIASQLHETYAADVAKILESLEASTAKRQAVRDEISGIEADLALAQRETQEAGRNLSQTFGSVLRTVATLHSSLIGTHEELKKECKSVQASNPARLLAFRQGLSYLDSGLALDRPLKRQLEALENRDSQIVSELKTLEARRDELRVELEDAKQKTQSLAAVMSRAGSLRESLATAAAANGSLQSQSVDPTLWVSKISQEGLESEQSAQGSLLSAVVGGDRKSTRLNSSHLARSRMPSSA